MENGLVFIHTVRPLVDVFHRLGAEFLPGIPSMHVLDELILERIRRRGSLAPEDAERLRAHVALAEEVGACAVLVTCSTISPCVDTIRPIAKVPVFKIDEAMIAEAVRSGNRIGIIATNATTLEPTRQLLLAQAAALGKPIAVTLHLVEGALASLLQGDGATHDALIKEAVRKMAGQSDLIVLAQASMARALEVIPEEERSVPVLSSPHAALAQLRQHFLHRCLIGEPR